MKKLSLYVFLVLIIFQTNIYADNEKKKIIVLINRDISLNF